MGFHRVGMPIGFSGGGQRDRDCQAAARGPIRARSSRHGFDEPARRGETKADAAGLPPTLEPLERLEDLVPVSFGYARAAVDGPDLDSRAIGARTFQQSGVGL